MLGEMTSELLELNILRINMINTIKKLFIIILCVSSIIIADEKNNNNDDSIVSKYNRAQKEHIKTFIKYATANSKTMSKEDINQLYNDFYKPISVWCTQADKLYEQSAQNMKDKVETTENPKLKQQLNFVAMKYEQASNLCKSVVKGYNLNDRDMMEINIHNYIVLEREMSKYKIKYPVREWVSSAEGDVALLQQRPSRPLRQPIQPRYPQPQSRQTRPQPKQP